MLHDLQDPRTQEPLITQDKLRSGQLPAQSEGQDGQGRNLLMLCKPFTDFANVGWLITLVDMTDIRRALQQRDQALHFISHDIRAPNASILTLLEMQRAYPGRMPADTLMQRIERYAQASSAWQKILCAWPVRKRRNTAWSPGPGGRAERNRGRRLGLASERDVQVTLQSLPDTAPCLGDRALLCRAVANVLNNAIKYSPENGVVQCSLQARGTHWVLAVRDEGPGIAPGQQDRLFAPFARLHDQSHPHISGVGLGLALVPPWCSGTVAAWKWKAKKAGALNSGWCCRWRAIRREPALVLIHLQRPAHVREGALRAVLAFAHLAPHADRYRRLGVLQVQAFGVHQARGMAHIAAQADGEGFCGAPYPPAQVDTVRAIHR